MKKKIVLLSFFLFILSQISANELKWYSDFSTGYCGYAGASYKGTTSTVNPGQLATTIYYDSILANQLQWLSVKIACIGKYDMAYTGDFKAKIRLITTQRVI